MRASEDATTSVIDPITAEIIRHGLLAIPKQIEVNITRTAFSPLVYEYKDYAVGVVSPDGRLISESQGGIPLFVANALGAAVQDGLEIHGRQGIQQGDVIFSNHAGTLGQHLNNVVMYTPIFAGENAAELVGFMAVLVHWVDVGGIAVGSCAPVGTTEIYQEGIQFRSVKLWCAGKPVADIYRTIEINTRFPQMLLGDLESQLAGCLLGRDEVATLADKYGVSIFRSAVNLIWESSEKAARAAIRKLPNGEYRASSFLDNDGLALDEPIRIEVVVRVEDDEMTIDLSGIADQVRGSINSGRNGGAVTVARIAFKYLVAPYEAANDGAFRPLHVIIPDGKFLSARADAPMAMYSTPLPTVIDTIMRAMVQAAPEQLAAGHHSNFAIHNLEGVSSKTGETYFNLTSGLGGWGGSLGEDGPGPYKTMSHGDTLDVPVEVQEALYPLRVIAQEIITDSPGAGAFRGGYGIEKVFVALDPCNVQFAIERTGCPPWGVLRGKNANPPTAIIERESGASEHILKGARSLQPGDRVRITTSGGGGYGDPRDRDLRKVAADVRLGYVSREGAARDYAVQVAQDGSIDMAATTVLRNSRRSR